MAVIITWYIWRILLKAASPIMKLDQVSSVGFPTVFLALAVVAALRSNP